MRYPYGADPFEECILIDFDVTVNEYLPLREVVFNTLRRAILKGELEPGERLMEVALANKLGVSRTPIREAIRKLELDGLVVMIPRKGAIVAKITEKDLRDVLEVRASLEDLATQLAVQRMFEDDIVQLRSACDAFSRAVDEGDDFHELAKKDVAFHDIIYAATENQRLVQMLNNLREQMYRYRLEYLKDESAHRTLAEEHIQITEAIRTRDEEKAVSIMHRHILAQEKAVLSKIHAQEMEEKAKKAAGEAR